MMRRYHFTTHVLAFSSTAVRAYTSAPASRWPFAAWYRGCACATMTSPIVPRPCPDVGDYVRVRNAAARAARDRTRTAAPRVPIGPALDGGSRRMRCCTLSKTIKTTIGMEVAARFRLELSFEKDFNRNCSKNRCIMAELMSS